MSTPSFFEPPFHFTVNQPNQEGGEYHSPDYPKQTVCEVAALKWLVENRPNSGVAMIYDANDALVKEVRLPYESFQYVYQSGAFDSQSLCEEAATRWLHGIGGGTVKIVDQAGKVINTISTR